MPEISFQVESAEMVSFAVAPTLSFKLRVTQTPASTLIQSIALRCQVQIDSGRRRYSPEESERVRDLFDRQERWSQTLRPMLWTHAATNVPSFQDSIVADLPVPCTFDFNVAATKYFAALEDGVVPLLFLMSGTMFHESDEGLQIAPVPWDREARFNLPVATWRTMMDHYYPNVVWLNLRRDAFERLDHFKRQHGLPTWEAAIERLLS